MYEHIVLISLDTLRADCLSTAPLQRWRTKYHIQSNPQTPALDDIAQRGSYFANCITAAPFTSASHASILTGRWPRLSGIHSFYAGKLKRPTLFSLAQSQGYFTIAKVDFPIILGNFLGFDRNVHEYLIEDDEKALRLIGNDAKTFSLLHFGGIHIPYGFHNLKFGGNAYHDTVESLEREIGSPLALPSDQLIETYRDNEDLRLLLRYKAIIQHYYEGADYDKLFDLYVNGINHFMSNRFESFLERLLTKLQGTRFLVVIFGDHGEEYDVESYGHHNTVSDGALRVPLILYGTDVVAKTYLERVRTIDLYPTLAPCLGISGDLAFDGHSLESEVFGISGKETEQLIDRRAFAQTYTSDTAQFIEFQKRMLSGFCPAEPLRHVRYAEAVYDGEYQLTMRNYHYGEHGGISGLHKIETVQTLYHQTTTGAYNPTNDSVAETNLMQLLNEYNNSLPEVVHHEANEIPEEIAHQLRAMGYRI